MESLTVTDRNGAEARPHRTRTTTTIRWLLALAWLSVVTRIWFSPDDDFEDPTFGAPVLDRREGTGAADVAVAVKRRETRKARVARGKTHKSSDEAARTIARSNHYKSGAWTASDALTSAPLSRNDTGGPPVDALRPTSFKECCIPAALVKEKNPDDVWCFGTCYTARACDDPIFPFSSAEEKALFPLADMSHATDYRTALARPCSLGFPETLRPPVDWCQEPHADPENATVAQLVGGIPPAGCSRVSQAGGSGAFQHAIVFPSAKLAVCGIPKVGITQWEQFLRFYLGAKDYPSLPHYKMDRNFFQFDNLEPRAQRRIWDDEAWTWAAFVRDPAERLLSAFLDKVDKKGSTLTFEAFVDLLSEAANFTSCRGNGRRGLSWCSDPHWRPQVYSCGMSERLDRFQFIGDLHHAAEQTRELLGHVGLWESHGKHFIQGGVQVGRSPWCNILSHPFDHAQQVGFQQKDEETNSSAAALAYRHAKDSRGKMEEYYTPSLLHKVREDLYSDDYKLWQLVNGNGKKLSKGVELASQLSQKCHGAHVVMPLP